MYLQENVLITEYKHGRLMGRTEHPTEIWRMLDIYAVSNAETN
jgi:hypothetical protein